MTKRARNARKRAKQAAARDDTSEDHTVTASVFSNRRWACDCGTFATVDEKVAVQHMQGHFRRRENYRVVVSKLTADAVTVEDIRGVRFVDGKPVDLTLEDYRREAEGVAEPRATKEEHYSTVASVRVMVRDTMKAQVNGLNPAEVIRQALAPKIPWVRVMQNPGGHDNKGRAYPTYRVMIDDEATFQAYVHHGSPNKRVVALARALGGLPEEQIESLLRAVRHHG